MSAMPNPHEAQGRVAAGRLLTLMAGKVSSSLDHFAGWLLSGFGAAYALLLANIEKVARFLDVAALRSALLMFAVAVVAGVIARYLGAIVSAGAATSADAAELGKELQAEDPGATVRVMLTEVAKAMFWPSRILVTASFRRVEAGDYAAGGRLQTKLAQVQGWLVLLVALMLVLGVCTIARGLAV